MPTDPGTIDITNLVAAMQSTFVTVAVNLAFAEILTVPGMSWVGLPIISSIVRSMLQFVIGFLANQAMLQAFYMNTAVLKASQAADYLSAVNTKNNLPPTATKEEVASAEQNEIASFNSLVIIS